MTKNLLYALTLFIFSALTIFSQTVQPTPPSEKEDDDVVKISTNLIQVDVTVTDKKGNIITDLKPEDFEIYENGENQKITNFSFVSNLQNETRPDSGSKEKVAPAQLPPPSPIRPEKVRRTIALVVDDLTLSFASTSWVKQALRKFVSEQMQEGDLVAIIRTGTGIGALQQFTSDKRQLYAAIEKIRFNLSGTGVRGIFNPIDGGADGNSKNSLDRNGSDNEFNEFRESVFTSGTLGAINFIIRGMQELPGRKSIALLSDGFPLFYRDARGVPQFTSVFNSMRRLIDYANRSSVVIYTIDAKGMDVPGFSASDNVEGLSYEPPDTIKNISSVSPIDDRDGLRYLARETGGFAIINSNDINHGLKRVLNDQSYYLIGYEPDDDVFDPKTRRFNKLVVKVKRDGARVRYRSGFFGISDEEIKKADNLTATQKMLNALTSPFAVNDVTLHLNTLYASNARQENLVRSYVHINGNDLSFTKDASGNYKSVFDLVALSFGDNGTINDELSQTYTITANESVYRRIKEKGFVYYFTFPVKKSGGYQMRVAVRDSVTNKVGSAHQFISVPNLGKKRLTLSGIALENLSLDQWSAFSADAASYQKIKLETDALTDTSLRRFKRNTVLRFGFDVYNAKLDRQLKSNLTMQFKIFRGGELYYEGKQNPINFNGANPAREINASGSVKFGSQMPLGEYVLQVIVTDALAKDKKNTVTEFVQFEIVE